MKPITLNADQIAEAGLQEIEQSKRPPILVSVTAKDGNVTVVSDHPKVAPLVALLESRIGRGIVKAAMTDGDGTFELRLRQVA